jgi:hypothetical protein
MYGVKVIKYFQSQNKAPINDKQSFVLMHALTKHLFIIFEIQRIHVLLSSMSLYSLQLTALYVI